jgi:hypothetical protein
MMCPAAVSSTTTTAVVVITITIIVTSFSHPLNAGFGPIVILVVSSLSPSWTSRGARTRATAAPRLVVVGGTIIMW